MARKGEVPNRRTHPASDPRERLAEEEEELTRETMLHELPPLLTVSTSKPQLQLSPRLPSYDRSLAASERCSPSQQRDPAAPGWSEGLPGWEMEGRVRGGVSEGVEGWWAAEDEVAAADREGAAAGADFGMEAAERERSWVV